MVLPGVGFQRSDFVRLEHLTCSIRDVWHEAQYVVDEVIEACHSGPALKVPGTSVVSMEAAAARTVFEVLTIALANALSEKHNVPMEGKPRRVEHRIGHRCSSNVSYRNCRMQRH